MTVDTGNLFAKAMAHAVAYCEAVATHPQPPSASYHAMLEQLAGPLPEEGRDAGKVIDDLAEFAEPGLMPMVGPRFFGWVIGASHPAGVAADWLVSARVQKDGTCFAAGAEWRGDWVMRLSITSGATTEKDIELSAAAIIAAWRAERG